MRVELAHLRGKSRCVILVEANQTLLALNDCSSASALCSTYLTFECESPTDYKETSQLKCHNCSHETRAMDTCDAAQGLGISESRAVEGPVDG